jgi:uncharacterized protein (TIGR03032 family)
MNISQPAPPFSCSYDPNFAEFLAQIDTTIVISTYQAGKVIFISPKNEEELVQLPRTFHKAMGIAVDGTERMAIATQDEVIVTVNSPALAATYPSKAGVYDALYLPRATYYTGQVDMHDLHFGKGTLWGINTSFSALCKIDADFSFKPVWKPKFISALASEDRCHLNGLAMYKGEPLYTTALGSGDKMHSWREHIIAGGIVMDISTGEVLAQGLAMPHSPRIYDDKLFVILSAGEEIVCIDPNTGKYDVVAHVPGFMRGMAKLGDYLFVGKSKIRKNSTTFKHLKIAEKTANAGVEVIHIPSGVIVAKLTFLASVDEIYDIQLLPGIRRPNMLNTYTDKHRQALHLSDSTFWADNITE